MAAAGVPTGYDSRADWGKGITSAMRDAEKSSTSVSSAYQSSLNNLIIKERGSAMDLAGINSTSINQMIESGIPVHEPLVQSTDTDLERVHEAWEVAQEIKSEWAKGVEDFGTVKNGTDLVFKPLPSMQVTAEDISDYVKTLDTEKAISTYSSGDPLLARQLEARTYGVNDDLSITPGSETKWIDEIGDKYGRSEENIAKKEARFEAAKLEGKNNAQELMAEMANDTIKAEILESQAIEEQVNQMIEQAELKAFDTQNELDVAHITNLEDNIEILNDRLEAERVSNLAAMKALGLTEDGAPYVQDKEKGTYEDDKKMQTVYRPAEIEFEQEALINEAKVKAELQAEKDLAEAQKLAATDVFMSDYNDATKGTATSSYSAVGVSGQDNYNNLTTIDLDEALNNEVLNTTTADMIETIGPGIEIPDDPLEVHFHPRIEAFNKLRGEKKLAEERAAKEKKLLEQSKTSGTIGQEQTKRLIDIEKKAEEERLLEQSKTSGTIGQEQTKRLKDRKAQENLKSNAKTTPLGQSFGLKEEKEASLAVQLAKHNMPMFMSDEAKKKMAGQMDRISSERGHGLDYGSPGNAYQRMGEGEKEGQEWYKNYKNRMANDPFRFSTFAYPRDVTTNMENGHYILFYVNVQNKTKYSYDGVGYSGDVVPVGDMIMTHESRERGTGKYEGPRNEYEVMETYMHTEWNTGASKVRTASGGKWVDDIDYQKRQVLTGMNGNILRSNMSDLKKGRKSYQGLDSVLPTTTRITDSVALYLPPNVSDDTGVSYSGSELGMAGFLAFSGIDVVNKWKQHDFEGVTDVVLGMGEGIIIEAIKKLGLEAFGALTGAEGVVPAFDKAFGQTLNPYIEVTFNSMGMRKFNYTFRFAPKDEQETQDVKDIINLFRFHMVPELKGTNHRYLTLPSTFDIHYMYQTSPENARENAFYNKIATCVLEGCNVDYTPGGVRSFASGAPTQITMSLSFAETKMLTKQRVNDGF